MENLDVMVLRTLRDWRQAGRRALLATVVRTWGSSPRPVGSIMALCEDGAVVGSVSGGCIEDDLIFRFTRAYASDGAASGADAQQIPSGPPQRVKYGITADEAHRFGLPCGGTLELLLWFVLGGVGTGIAGTFLLRYITRPLNDVVGQAEAIADRRFILIPEPRTPELKALLDGLTRIERETGWRLCAYGRIEVAPVDPAAKTIPIAVDREINADGEATYVVADRVGD